MASRPKRTTLRDIMVREPVKREEDNLQRAQVELLKVYRAQGRLRFFAVPNGGQRSKAEAAILVGLGVVAGVPDVVLTWSTPFCGGKGSPLPQVGFIENKARKGQLSDAQKEWGAWLVRNGFRYAVVRTMTEFMATLHAWGLISDREMGKVAA